MNDNYLKNVTQIEELSEQTNRLRQILDLQKDITLSFLPDTTLTFLNKAGSEWLGNLQENLLGIKLTSVLTDSLLEDLLSGLQAISIAKKPFDFEQKYNSQNQANWYQWTFYPILDELDEVVEIHAVAKDITASKIIEENSSKSEWNFQKYIEIAPEGIFILDKDGLCRYVNQAAITLVGYPKEILIGKNLIDFLKKKNEFTHFIRTAQTTELSIETEIIQASNSCIPVLLDIAYFDEHYICFSKDISALKKTEKELKSSKRKAEYAAAVKSQFLSTMSHEIRTPLNAVIAITHLLLEEDPSPAQISNLNILKFSAENLLVLINDILDYNKIESGKINFEQIDFNLKDLLFSIREGLRYKAEEKGLKIEIRLDSQIHPFLVGDTVRLSQIFTNLIDNAVKFTDKGKVILEATQAKSEDRFEYITFSVKDTGIGIEADKLEMIFERFTQASSDTTRKFGGTGLGLAITKKLLELQGSTIQVESEVGNGSRFFFTLKLPKSQEKIYTPEKIQNFLPSNNQLDLKGAKILLVEDNEMNRLVAKQFLQKWNTNLDFAPNGQIALEMVQLKQYDVVLMDLQMPVLDGYKASKKIRKLNGIFANLPIIALTASAMTDVKNKVHKAGMNDYITKPFNPTELYTKIMQYIQPLDNAENEDEWLEKWENLLHLQEIQSEKFFINYQKVLEISGGNKAFIRQYNDLAIKLFQEFPIDFEIALRERNPEKLSKISHHIRATLALLEFEELNQLLAEAKLLVRDKKATQETIFQNIEQVTILCRKALAFIQEQNL